MFDILRTAEAQVVLLLAVLAIMSAVGWSVVARFRDQIKDDKTDTDVLAEFLQMHQRGDLSQAEYRTIKTIMADQVQDRLNSNDGKGQSANT